MLCVSELRFPGSTSTLVVILDNLKNLLRDLETCQREGDWRDVPNTHVPIYAAGIILLREIVVALDVYFIAQDETKMHQEFISAGMNFITRWEIWLDALQPGSLRCVDSKVFHEYLLRFCKGILKAYRVWRIDFTK